MADFDGDEINDYVANVDSRPTHCVSTLSDTYTLHNRLLEIKAQHKLAIGDIPLIPELQSMILDYLIVDPRIAIVLRNIVHKMMYTIGYQIPLPVDFRHYNYTSRTGFILLTYLDTQTVCILLYIGGYNESDRVLIWREYNLDVNYLLNFSESDGVNIRYNNERPLFSDLKSDIYAIVQSKLHQMIELHGRE